MTTAENSQNGFQLVKTASRTLEVLEALAVSSRRQTLGELSEELSIPKSSLHGILRTMEHRGWVETDESGQRFGLGVHALFVGTSYVDRDDAIARVQPVLEWLSDQLGEAIHMGRLDGTDIVHLAKRESTHSLRLYSEIGRRLPAHTTAIGKALLAERSKETVRDLLPPQLAQLTHHTLTRWHDLEVDLDLTRQRGYSIDNEENSDGTRCFAVTLPNARPGILPIDAVGVSIPIVRLDADAEAKTVSLLREARNRYAHPEQRNGTSRFNRI